MTDDERTKGPLEVATEFMLAEASHLHASVNYAGTMEALLTLARKIDGHDAVYRAAVEWAEEKSGRRPNVPLHDGNSLGSYARLCDMLGLTPVSQAKLAKLGENLNRAPAKKTTTKGETGDDDAGKTAGAGRLARVSALRGGVSAS